MKTLLASFLLLAAACGGASESSPAADTTPDPAVATAPAAGEAAHPALTPELDALHAQLSPVWHHDGADRQDKACGAVAGLVDATSAVTAAGPAEGADPAAWDAGEENLAATAAALQAACAGTGEFEASFAAFHDAFHAMMALTPAGKAHHDGEHHHGGEHHHEGGHAH